MKRLGGVVVLLAVAVTGCSAIWPVPSPTTAYTGAQGETITVDWADYPGQAGVDGEALLGHADQSTLEPKVRALLRELQAAVADASGLELNPVSPEQEWFSDENWYLHEDNGYGGESLLVTLSCCDLATDAAPEPHKWQSVFDAVSEVTVTAGLGPIVRKQYSAEMEADPTWRQDYLDTACNLDGGECWMWSGSTYNGVHRVDFSIQDASLDPARAGSDGAANPDSWVDYIHISYGAIVVRSGKSAEYERAIQPFVGLEQPAATTRSSD